MRLYTFTNFYLSSIQQGIQPAHVVGELFVKYITSKLNFVGIYGPNSPEEKLRDWGENHKTMVCLNGGNNADLHELYPVLAAICHDLNLPFAKFHEDEQSLGGVVTSVGCVVPAKIYDAAAEVRAIGLSRLDADFFNDFNEAERKLIEVLNSYGLAK